MGYCSVRERAEKFRAAENIVAMPCVPVKAWHDGMQDPTLADAILDRLVHNAYKLELKGESMRRTRTVLDQ
jgi:DNA replication protein DnaC